ncbi:MAG: biotin--[acetyl-CoA-carboxylase] ligase [Oscillospiraceae bacterium]|nr:biotin--[acetyl-CoA-carboxylase] ligase [Oscillospiraceae bacterium]
MIDFSELKPLLADDIDLIFLDEVDSTNNYVKRFKKPYNRECLVIARTQTAGRGTKGRSFFSPYNSGLYMSYSFVPNKSAHDLIPITPAAALAVYDAIKTYYGLSADIKWVNDIEIESRKLCGILTEMVSIGEADKYRIIIGIGINIFPSSYPEEIQNKAVALSEFCHVRDVNQFVSSIILNLRELLDSNRYESMQRYRALCSTIGKTVTFELDCTTNIGKAIDIDDFGHLIVSTKEKTITLKSAYVSIKETTERKTDV